MALDTLAAMACFAAFGGSAGFVIFDTLGLVVFETVHAATSEISI